MLYIYIYILYIYTHDNVLADITKISQINKITNTIAIGGFEGVSNSKESDCLILYT